MQRLGVAIGVLIGGLLAFPYTVDDAYIVGRYARHLATGLGYVMNPQEPASDGVTGPLWLLPGVIAHGLSLDPVLAAKWFGLLCSTLAAVVWIDDRVRHRRAPAAAWFAALVLALQPTYATWSVAGLEAGAAALALALLAHGGIREDARANSLFRGICAGALCWLRPELVPVGLVLLLAQQRPVSLGLALGAFAMLLLAILAFRLAMFGNPWPLSARAKPSSLRAGVEYATRATVMVSGVFGLVAAWLGARRSEVGDGALGLALLAGLACIVLSGGDWMPGFRLLSPLLPLYAVLVGEGLAGLQRRRGLRASLGLFVLVIALPAADFGLRLPELWTSAHSRKHVGAKIAAAVAAQSGRVLLVDVGFIPYASDVLVADLGGITDAEVGDLPGSHLDKRIPEALVRRWKPTQLLLHSRTPPQILPDGRLRGWNGYPVERRLAQMPYVRENFRAKSVFAYGPTYHYVWLVREEDNVGSLGD